MAFLNWFKKKPIRLCKDCKWYKYDGHSSEDYDRCLTPKKYSSSFTIIRGTESSKHGYCIDERKDYPFGDTCGKKAKYFEPKEDL